MFAVEVKVDENPVQVTLCDTAGQDFLDPLRRLCYPDSDVFLLCFSVIKPDTFVSIREKWAPIFRKSQTPIVLIGTQADLRNDPDVVSALSVWNLYYKIKFAAAVASENPQLFWLQSLFFGRNSFWGFDELTATA